MVRMIRVTATSRHCSLMPACHFRDLSRAEEQGEMDRHPCRSGIALPGHLMSHDRCGRIGPPSTGASCRVSSPSAIGAVPWHDTDIQQRRDAHWAVSTSIDRGGRPDRPSHRRPGRGELSSGAVSRVATKADRRRCGDSERRSRPNGWRLGLRCGIHETLAHKEGPVPRMYPQWPSLPRQSFLLRTSARRFLLRREKDTAAAVMAGSKAIQSNRSV